MRVKRGTAHVKRRRNLKKQAKGFRWGRKNKLKLAKVAVTKAGAFSYRDRRNKKRDFRALWLVRINAALRLNGMSYSKFIGALKAKNIELDRKVLSELAAKHPEVFAAIVKAVK